MSKTPLQDPRAESGDVDARLSDDRPEAAGPPRRGRERVEAPESPESPESSRKTGSREANGVSRKASGRVPGDNHDREAEKNPGAEDRPGSESLKPPPEKRIAKKKRAPRKKRIHAKKEPERDLETELPSGNPEVEKQNPEARKSGAGDYWGSKTAEASAEASAEADEKASAEVAAEADPEVAAETDPRESIGSGEESVEPAASVQQSSPRETKAERHRRRRERRREQREREREREAALLASAPVLEIEGLVEISPKGFGFLRQRERAYLPAPDDVFVTPEIVRIHGLRDGVWVKGLSKQGSRGPQLIELLQINGKNPDAYHNLPYFEELTAINPNKRLALETKPDRLTTRIIDMMTPIGRGQRGLIVAPPRTGKTTFLHHIAEGILENYEDEVHLMVMLIDERPEEVTDFVRSFPAADVFASSNDADVKSHVRMAQLAIERAKRLVEAGEHVFILLDSITRLARAFNNSIGGQKKRGTQTGGLAVGALEIPRKLFAAARNTREAGSLTIIATALIQTNSKMDEAIFQEFKGTGNLELVLDRQLAQNYVYPAVDINRSGTRREELLITGHMLEKIYVIRRGIAGYKPIDAMEWLIKAMKRYQSNAQMLLEIRTSAVA